MRVQVSESGAYRILSLIVYLERKESIRFNFLVIFISVLLVAFGFFSKSVGFYCAIIFISSVIFLVKIKFFDFIYFIRVIVGRVAQIRFPCVVVFELFDNGIRQFIDGVIEAQIDLNGANFICYNDYVGVCNMSCCILIPKKIFYEMFIDVSVDVVKVDYGYRDYFYRLVVSDFVKE